MSKNKNYDSIDDLFSELENDILNIAENEIADKIIEMAQDSVQENVLNVYEPQHYNRRSGSNSGGLKDTWGKEITKENNCIDIKVSNMAKSSNAGFDDLAENIENGYGNKNNIWNSARPFIAPLQEELNDSNEIEELLLNNLKKKGYDIN